MEHRPFQPLYKKAVVGATSTNGTLIASVLQAATGTAATAALPGQGTANTICQIQVANQTSVWAYVNFGIFGSVTAATTTLGYPVAPGSVAIVTVDPEVNGFSVILDSGGTGNVIFTRGEGM